MSISHLVLPPSNNHVTVRMVDTTALLAVPTGWLAEPVQAGHNALNLPCVAFMIEHELSGKKVMFDFGCRVDYWNYPDIVLKTVWKLKGLKVEKATSDVLKDCGVSLDSISSVIWSHYHWDHTGDMSLLPPSTEVVVGPGFKSSPALLPGFPKNTHSPVCASDFEGRTLREIDFSDTGLHIGGFSAYDFFGDGSFYLLDTPGHCLGHICGLARTTAGPDSTFLLLGGDICHFIGQIRPTVATPFPDEIPATALDSSDPPYFPIPCPCSLFSDNHPIVPSSDSRDDNKRRTTPFYRVAQGEQSQYENPPMAQHSVDKLVEFNSSPSVFVCIAHDPGLLKHLPTLNADRNLSLNNWKVEGWKEACRWDWLNELPRNGRPGRKSVVEGFWREGKPWEDGPQELRKKGERAT